MPTSMQSLRRHPMLWRRYHPRSDEGRLVNHANFSICCQERMSPKIDPITRSVVQHRLSSIVKEMGEAMLRTSYSQILNSSRDFSLGICDTHGRLIAQADHIPVHVGALPWATLAVEARFKDVKPGDVILLNDPYHGGSHLPDLTAFVPIFDGERRLFWANVRAHPNDNRGGT